MPKVKLDIPQEESKFPLSLEHLSVGFYEASNDTVVFKSRGEVNTGNPINIANGIGGYNASGDLVKFRALPKGSTLTIKS